MSHFAGNTSGAVILGKPYAAIAVTVKGKKLMVEMENRESIKLTKSDTKWVKVPEGYGVFFDVGEDKPVGVSGQLYVTADTIDPCHLVADFPKDQEFV